MSKTQHRPKRDGRKTRELADFKRENNQLKRAISKLQKELGRAEFNSHEISDILNDLGPQEVAKCEACGAINLAYFQTPSGKEIISCLACKSWRKELTPI